jgi:hypothetical protein
MHLQQLQKDEGMVNSHPGEREKDLGGKGEKAKRGKG